MKDSDKSYEETEQGDVIGRSRTSLDGHALPIGISYGFNF